MAKSRSTKRRIKSGTKLVGIDRPKGGSQRAGRSPHAKGRRTTGLAKTRA